MGFDLQTRPVSAKLKRAFEGASEVELRELPWLEGMEASAAGTERCGRASFGLLAASLHVDGKPVGLDVLLSLPGRFTAVLGAALADCHALHGMGGDDEAEGEPSKNA